MSFASTLTLTPALGSTRSSQLVISKVAIVITGRLHSMERASDASRDSVPRETSEPLRVASGGEPKAESGEPIT